MGPIRTYHRTEPHRSEPPHRAAGWRHCLELRSRIAPAQQIQQTAYQTIIQHQSYAPKLSEAYSEKGPEAYSLKQSSLRSTKSSVAHQLPTRSRRSSLPTALRVPPTPAEACRSLSLRPTTEAFRSLLLGNSETTLRSLQSPKPTPEVRSKAHMPHGAAFVVHIRKSLLLHINSTRSSYVVTTYLPTSRSAE